MSISANQQPSSLPSPDDVITNHYNDFLHIECDVGLFTAASTRNRSLVMINSATMDIQLVKHVWKYCDHKICADGGANRLFDGLLSTETDQFIPGQGESLYIATALGSFWRLLHNLMCHFFYTYSLLMDVT